MAKKKSVKKFLGKKVSRGTNNGALTPSGGQSQDNILETAIRSSSELIVEQLKENAKVNESVITIIDTLKSFDVSKLLKDAFESIEDKMVAMLGAMYGTNSANKGMKSGQYLSTLNKIDPMSTANSGIYMSLRCIEEILANASQLYTSRGGDVKSITNDILNKLIDIRSILSNQDKATVETATGNKTAASEPQQVTQDVKVEFRIENMKEFTSDMQIIVDNIKHMFEGDGDVKTLNRLNGFIESLITANANITVKDLQMLDKKIDLLTVILGEDDDEGIRYTFALIDEAIKKGHLIKKVDSITRLGKLLKAVSIIGEDVEFKPLIALTGKLLAMDAALGVLPLTWKLLDKAVPSNKKDLLKKIDDIKEILDKVQELDVKKITALSSFAKCVMTLNMSLAAAGVLVPFALIGLLGVRLEMSLVKKVVDKIDEIEISDDTTEKLKSIAIVVTACAGILLLAAIVGQYVTANLPNVLGFTISLGLFIMMTIGAINLSTRGMNEAMTNVEDFGMIVIVSAYIMTLGGLIMTKYPQLILGSLMFAVALGAFMLLVIQAYKFATRGDFQNIHEHIEDMQTIVGLSAAMMIVGGLFMMIPGLWESALKFTVLLAGFIFGVTTAYSLASKSIGDSMQYAEAFSKLVAISAASLLIGGLLFYINPWLIASTLLFGVMLTTFIYAVTLAYSRNAKDIKTAIFGAKSFGILIALSAAALVLGGYAILKNPSLIAMIPVFGALLIGFVFAVGYAYKHVAEWMKDNMDVARQFYALVGLSTAILMIGGAFMLIDGMGWATLQFAALLTGFVVGVSYAYSFAAKHLKKSAVNTAKMLTVLIAATAAVMLIAGMMFLNNDGLFGATLQFAILTAAFVGLMGLVVFGLSMIPKKKLETGIIAMGGIVILIYAMSYVMERIAAIKLDWKQTLITLGFMYGAIVAMGAIVYVLSKIISAGGGMGALFMAGGMAAMWGLIKLVDMTVEMVKGIAEANDAIADMKTIETDKVVSAIKGFLATSTAFSALSNPALAVTLSIARYNTACLASCIAMIADAVQKISNLTIPLMDENGKVIGVRTLDESDFENAAQNVERIITVLGSAIIETYDKNKEIFSTGSTLGDLLGMDTPFARVCKSCAVMGQMIADIAKGVKEYADLRIATYDENGKRKGSRQMNEKDFESAAKNISTIITTLGGAVIATYNSPGAKEMFEWKLFGDNPFAMVVKSCRGLGKMISDIAKGVKDYADLRIATYDENGKVTGSRQMNEDDFDNAATNVGKVLTILGTSILQTYKDNPDLFTDASKWHTDADKTPFGMVVKAMSGTGALISEGAKAIKDVLALDIDWSEQSKELIKKKVAFCISVLADAIKSIAVGPDGKTNPAFTDTSLFHNSPGDTPVGMVIGTLQGSSKLINEGIGLIKTVAELPEYDRRLILDRVDLAIATLATSIVDLAETHKDVFEDKGWFSQKPENSAVGMVKGALKGSVELVKGGVDIIAKISQLKVNDKTIGTVVQNIVAAVPNAILRATVYNADENLRDWWNDDPSDDFKDIGAAYGSMSNVLNKVVKVYADANRLLHGDNAADVTMISFELSHMLKAIPTAISDAQKYAIDKSTLDVIVESYENYESAVSTILKIYDSTWRLFKKFGATSDNAVIDMIGQGICKMGTYMMMSINSLTGLGLDKLKEQVDSFTSAVNTYQQGITNLAVAFNTVPADTEKYDNMRNAIKGVNLEIVNIPNLDRFEQETKLICSYVRSVNSINGSKVDRLTGLANALTTMSTKLGSLESLTDVLANKVAVVLTELTQRIDQSASIIKTAEKIQTSRHAKINESLKRLKELMNKPLNVSVVHRQDDNNGLPEGSMTTEHTSSDGSTGGNNGNMSSSSGGYTGSDSSSTGGNVRKVAREEAHKAINEWQAKQRNKNLRGGGARPGAN